MNSEIFEYVVDNAIIEEITKIFISNSNIVEFENMIIRNHVNYNEFEIPYDIQLHKFKHDFIYTLFFIINVDINLLSSYLKLKQPQRKMGFSTLHNYLNVRYKTQSSRTGTADKDIIRFFETKCKLHQWYLVGWSSVGLREFVRSIEHLLCGSIDMKNKWAPNGICVLSKFDASSIEQYRKQVMLALHNS